MDSLLLENGEYRERIILSGPEVTQEHWIEGIGSYNTPLNLCWNWEGGGYLICFYQNFQYLISTHCSYIGIDENKIMDNFIIYPNPNTGILNIELPEGLNVEKFFVYNMLGERVLVILPESNKKILNVDLLPVGVYIVEMVCADRTFQSKLIKN